MDQLTTYTNMANLYVQYVHRHYNHAVVVFDGYANGPSTKDETHQRRTSSHNIMLGSISGQIIQLTMKKTSFLANTKKKQNFLYFIGSKLDITGIKVQHSASDADYNILSDILSDINILTLQDVNPDVTASPLFYLHALRMQHCVQTIWHRKDDGNGQM